MNFKETLLSAKEGLLKLPVVRNLSKRTLAGGENHSEITLTNEEEQNAMNWAQNEKGIPFIDVSAGLTVVKPTPDDRQREILVKNNVIKPSEFLEKQEQQQQAERRIMSWKTLGKAVVVFGIIAAFCGPVGRAIGPFMGDAGRIIGEAVNHSGSNMGEKMALNSLENGPEDIYDSKGKGFLDLMDSYKNQDTDLAKDFRLEIPGFQNGIRAMIDQNFEEIYKYKNDLFIERYKEFINEKTGKPKTIETLINYFKSFAQQRSLNLSEEYWKILEEKINSLLR